VFDKKFIFSTFIGSRAGLTAAFRRLETAAFQFARTIGPRPIDLFPPGLSVPARRPKRNEGSALKLEVKSAS
jgi:hypothetical protein